MARFAVTACHIQMKAKAYNKFSLPPNKKATAGKARALRLRGGARNPPKRPQRSLSKTNQSLRHLPGAVHANGHRACQAVGVGAGLQCFPPYRPELHQSAALGSVKGNKVECAPQTARRSLQFAWFPALVNTSENHTSDTNGEPLLWAAQTLLGLLQCS